MGREFQQEREHRSLDLTAPTLRAPADRARFRRGWRGPLSVVSLLGALVVVLHGGSAAGGSWESVREGSVEYTLDGPAWTGPVLWTAVAVLVVAAGILWLSRRPLVVFAGVAGMALAVAGAVYASVEREQSGRNMTKANV